MLKLLFVLITFSSYSILALENLDNMDLRFDFVKISRLKLSHKYLVELCNPSTGQTYLGKVLDQQEVRLQRRYKNDGINRCQPLTGNKEFSCYEFVPKSEIEKELSKNAAKNGLVGLVFFPLLFIGLAEHNEARFLEIIRQQIEKNNSDKIFVGINKLDPNKLQFNSKLSNGSYDSRTEAIFINPYSSKWPYSSAKFARRINYIMHRSITKEITNLNSETGIIETQNITIKADLSCR